MSAPGSEHAVTVVMRTRGRPLFLARALASVGAQTFADYELVVVDDGGDRETVEGLIDAQSFAPGALVRSLHHEEPVELFSPPNAPIRETTSRFVVVHDDDDSWHPEFLERTTRYLEETGAMGIVAPTERIVEQLEGDRIVELDRARLHPGVRYLSLYEACFENFATPIAFLYQRQAFEELGGYDESLATVADWDFAIRFLTRFELEILDVPEALAFYHHRPDGGGGELNSVYTERHRRDTVLLANRYLRDDLAQGRCGLGLVVNELRNGYERGEAAFARVERASDSRTEYLAACVAKLDARVAELQASLTPSERLKDDLRFIRALPGRVAARIGRRAPP